MSRPSQFGMPTQRPSSWRPAMLVAVCALSIVYSAQLLGEPPVSGLARDSEAASLPGAGTISSNHAASNDSEIIPRKPPKHAAGNRTAPAAATSGGWTRMLQPIIVVFGLMAILTWAGRKWLPQARAASTAQSVIRVLARQHLSSKQSLCLVKLGPRVVLLGVTPECIASVLEVRDPDEAATLLAAVESSRGRSFTKAMAAFAEQEQVESSESDLTDRAPDANEQIREMVRRVRALGAGSQGRTGSKLPVAPRR